MNSAQLRKLTCKQRFSSRVLCILFYSVKPETIADSRPHSPGLANRPTALILKLHANNNDPMPLKRFLTLCFLLLTLAGNAAWATAGYHPAADMFTVADPGAGHQQNFPDGDSDGCNDHCCHASAHLLGFPDAPTTWTFSPSPDIDLASDQPPRSQSITPLFQPPIA